MKMFRVSLFALFCLLFFLPLTDLKSQTALSADDFFTEGTAAHDRNDFPLAIRLYSVTLEKNGRFSKAYFNRALCYQEQGKYYLAAQDFQKYLEFEPGDKTALEMYGNMAFLNGKLDLAIYQYSQLLALEPNQVVLLNRGMAYFQNNQLAKARSDFELLKESDSGNALIYNYLGEICCAEGNFQAGFENFEKALELDPKDAVIRNNYGKNLAKAGKYAEASVQFENALKIAPQSSTFANKALVDLENGNIELAKVNAQLAIDRDFKNALAYFAMGKTEFQTGNFSEAIEYFKMSCDLKPKEPLFFFSLGLAHYSKNEKEDANTAFLQVLEIDPNFPNVHSYLNQ